MKRLRHALVVALAGLLLLLCGAAGCLSPTLPLPPPEEPDYIAQSADGLWDIRGSSRPGSLVIIKNIDNGSIVGVEDLNDTGRYYVQLPALLCDEAEVFEIIDETEVSSPTRFIIRPTDDPTLPPCDSGG